MKKLLFVSIFLSFFSFAYAADEVYLDINALEINRFKTGEFNFGNTEKSDDNYDDEKYLKPSDMFDSIKNMFYEDIYSPNFKK